MLIHMPYGETFRRARKWTHDAFSSKAALKTYVQLQHRETYNLLAGLIDAPEDFFTVFARYLTSQPFAMSLSPPLISTTLDSLRLLSPKSPTATP